MARAITKKETVIFHLYVRSYGLDAHASKFFQKKSELDTHASRFFPQKVDFVLKQFAVTLTRVPGRVTAKGSWWWGPPGRGSSAQARLPVCGVVACGHHQTSLHSLTTDGLFETCNVWSR